MKRKINKYDIVIYSCLILAIICLLLGGRDYFNSLENESTVKDEVKSAIKSINGAEEGISTSNDTGKPEPEELINFDKKSLVQKYVDSIIDQILEDEVITYAMVNSWGDYEIVNVEYDHEVTDNYYAYKADIKISNKKGLIPGDLNEELSTEENPVLKVNVYIEYSSRHNGYIVKYMDV